MKFKNPFEDFEPAPAGAHPAVCVRVIALGSQPGYQGKEEQEKIALTFELVGVSTSTGKRYTLTKQYTKSLHEKSAFRRDLDAWRGKPFTEDDFKIFDIRQVLGRPCTIVVEHTAKDGKTFANVGTVSAAQRGFDYGQPVNALLYFDLDDGIDDAVFFLLPDWQRKLIEASPEFRKLRGLPPLAIAKPATQQSPQNNDLLDDSIHF